MVPLAVEFRRRSIEDKSVFRYIVLNNVPDFDSEFRVGRKKADTKATFASNAVIDILCGYTFKEVSKHFKEVTFRKTISSWPFTVELAFEYIKLIPRKAFVTIGWMLQIEYQDWNYPYSINNFYKAFSDLLYAYKPEKYQYNAKPNSVGIELTISNATSQIAPYLEGGLQLLNLLVGETTAKLTEELNKEELTALFSFPEEIKTSCQQYLIYFVQFLEDLGIEALASIKEETNTTVFKVVPRNKDEALEKIQEALEVYLNAPGSKVFKTQTEGYDDIAISQWKANVAHLEGQIQLAKAIMQAKDAQIEYLQLSNFQLQNRQPTIELSVQKDKEDIIPGIVAVKKVEVKGVEINLPEIVRKLKRGFNK
jgi:hypothetical protein